jgi:hypothetical protein
MKKDEYRRWFSDQLVLQNRLLMGAIAAMAGLGLIATLMEMVIFASILRVGFVGSWILAFLLTTGILGWSPVSDLPPTPKATCRP